MTRVSKNGNGGMKEVLSDPQPLLKFHRGWINNEQLENKREIKGKNEIPNGKKGNKNKQLRNF